MKKSQLRKIIRENIRQVMAEQGNPPTGGSWPGFMQWTSTFSGTLYSVQNPCNFLKNQSDNLASKYPTAGKKYKSQLYMKIFMMNFIAMNYYGCGELPSLSVIFGTLDLGQYNSPNISE